MDETTPETEAEAMDRPERPGDILRRAREAQGLSMAEVAESTRVALRQLEAIEKNDFAALPGTPYAVGFARAFARAVGADEVEIARKVREELGAVSHAERYEAFEPVDPARIPPRSLAWVAALVAVVLAVGYGVWRTQFFSASTDEEISALTNRTAEAAPAAAPNRAAPAPATGPVVLTAIDDVWLRIYDEAGDRLFEKQMAKGESYTVPDTAKGPMILTGRPNAIAVTVGGRAIAPLGPPERTIADVPISASALLARPAGADGASAGAVSPPVAPAAASAGAAARPRVHAAVRRSAPHRASGSEGEATAGPAAESSGLSTGGTGGTGAN